MNLYKLEMMKMRSAAYMWAVFWIFTGLLALGIMFLFLGAFDPEEDVIFKSWNGLYGLVTAMTTACFGIFSAVTAAKAIVDEYCGRNAVVFFTYPIRRKKLLYIKCMLVLCITTVAAFISNASVAGIMYVTAGIFGIMPEMTDRRFVSIVLLSSFLAGILSSETGMIAAVVGWKKRSVTATIVCALLLMCFVPNLIAGFPDNIIQGMLLISALFGLAAGFLYQVLVNGIEGMEV